MKRQAAHRHAVARGEREVQQLRAALRVLKEHFVKIAEPEQQQRVLGQFTFDAAILRHHRRQLGFGGHGGKLNMNEDKIEQVLSNPCVDSPKWFC